MVKRITYEWDGAGRGPRPGDVLRTKTGREWTVVASRQVQSRVHLSRWALGVEAGAPPARRSTTYCSAGSEHARLHGGPLVFPLAWTPRGAK